jgi:anion-transporting  ArsA/GET3 family ATPase
LNLFDKRFVINTGKGGVGKSTLTAGMALAAVRRGKRVLVIELNTKERVSRLFGVNEVGSEIGRIYDNLWAVNITPDAAMKEYVLMKLKVEMIYRAVFGNRFVKQFLRVIPGLNELVLIGKAWYHEKERDARGRPKYDFIVIDAPATGHGLFFLQIPKVITEAVATGPMARECQEILDLLQDPERTVLNLITLTEEMPVNETIELKAQVDEILEMPMGYLIANGVYPTLFTAREGAEVSSIANARPGETDLAQRLLNTALFRHERCELQATYLDRLSREIKLPIIEVPFYFEPELNFSVIEKIAENIEESVARQAL